MIISTDSISPHFRLYNPADDSWISRDLLLEFVHFWKIIFVEKNQLKKGHKIGLGFPMTDVYYFGALYAAAELGLRLVVLDVHTKILSKNQSQLQDFLPLDLFISGKQLTPAAHDFYQSISRQTEYWNVWDEYKMMDQSRYQNIVSIKPDPDDILLLCTSSGTTDRPKKVEHTHRFLHDIARRNCDLLNFDGRVLHVRNLHHGSSLAVHFLPSLMSDRCTAHYVFNYESDDNIAGLVDFCQEHQINHLQFPYTKSIDDFLTHAVKHGVTFKDLTLYTLSYINPDWQPLIQQCGVREIISIFGCNETSGPLFINSLTGASSQFDPKDFVSKDGFYRFSFNEHGQLLVYLDQYDRTIIMQDLFERCDNHYLHKGRSDILRINDIKVDFFWLLQLCQNNQVPGQIVLDRDREKLYLAVWDHSDTNRLVQQLNNLIEDRYGPQVCISSAQNLKYEDYLIGIKLDHERLRTLFRNYDHAKTSAS